ncbi:MAG TPA: uracil-DNA glycosylase [Gammaproteobacteria bacterium]|jgi:uracil-DNA glycosylase|nr:uracil-DNA glycosylase [Gammaproteobacteria bacterium]
MTFQFSNVDPSWQPCLQKALGAMDQAYLQHLYQNTLWLPGPDKILNAFSLPLSKVRYILFGESPYPRAASANGFAFWDAHVKELWSDKGLSKPVNRATSLRNIIKMLLVGEKVLDPHHLQQEHIVKINKENFVNTNNELFQNFLQHGFLLLNATLVLQPTEVKTEVKKDARAWHPFMKTLLEFFLSEKNNVELILFGNIANTIQKIVDVSRFKTLYVEHPYNLSFITNPKVLEFFTPLQLLRKK